MPNKTINNKNKNIMEANDNKNKEAINLLDDVYSLIMENISDKNSDRTPQIKYILGMIDNLQNEIEEL